MAEPVTLWPRALALALPAGLLGGALFSQYGFGLYPCEMCMWQRWPHYAALVPALGALLIRQPAAQRLLLVLAALLIAVSGAIGVFHAGVEYDLWEGLTQCATTAQGTTLEDILNAPIVRCDVAPWTLAGISLAGYNAIISLGGAALILFGMRRPR
jgi:disulfide bond formation protein DsbB